MSVSILLRPLRVMGSSFLRQDRSREMALTTFRENRIQKYFRTKIAPHKVSLFWLLFVLTFFMLFLDGRFGFSETVLITTLGLWWAALGCWYYAWKREHLYAQYHAAKVAKHRGYENEDAARGKKGRWSQRAEKPHKPASGSTIRGEIVSSRIHDRPHQSS